MKQLILLQAYKDYTIGEIISESSNVAFGLIENGIARETVNRDFLVKPKFGVSKAFNTSKLNKGRRTITESVREV